MLHHAIREELIGRNVAEPMTLPTVRKRKRTVRTSEEAVLDFANGELAANHQL